MTTFFMFGKYSADSLRKIDAQRTQKACELIGSFGGKVHSAYALLGEHDLVFIVELPRMADAMKVAVVLGQLTGISFSTCAALPIEEFDRMADDLEMEIQAARMEAGE